MLHPQLDPAQVAVTTPRACRFSGKHHYFPKMGAQLFHRYDLAPSGVTLHFVHDWWEAVQKVHLPSILADHLTLIPSPKLVSLMIITLDLSEWCCTCANVQKACLIGRTACVPSPWAHTHAWALSLPEIPTQLHSWEPTSPILDNLLSSTSLVAPSVPFQVSSHAIKYVPPSIPNTLTLHLNLSPTGSNSSVTLLHISWKIFSPLEPLGGMMTSLLSWGATLQQPPPTSIGSLLQSSWHPSSVWIMPLSWIASSLSSYPKPNCTNWLSSNISNSQKHNFLPSPMSHYQRL